MTLKVQTHPPTYLSVTAQKLLKIDETAMPVAIRFIPLISFLSSLLRVNQPDVPVNV